MRERSKSGQDRIDWLIEQTRAMAEKSNDVNFTSELLGKIHGPVFGTHAAKFAQIGRIRSRRLS